jgi:hypothetical protein
MLERGLQKRAEPCFKLSQRTRTMLESGNDHVNLIRNNKKVRQLQSVLFNRTSAQSTVSYEIERRENNSEWELLEGRRGRS